ncbi:MAG: alpha/beta fold hydrolase [Microbacterium sp.]
MTADISIDHGPRRGETIVMLHGNSVAGWMWEPQVARLPDRHLLTPDLPGLGSRVGMLWPGMPGAADDIARLIRERAIGGRAHVVGLSLGGFVAVHLLQRHPELVRSCTITGVALSGLGPFERLLVAATVPLWRQRWFWSAQAFAFRVPADARTLFVDAGAGVPAESNRRTFAEVAHGAMPDCPFDYHGPLLAVAGEKESRSIRAGFPPLRTALPQLRTWIAPGMHHAWNIEDPDLFTEMIANHADTGKWPPM